MNLQGVDLNLMLVFESIYKEGNLSRAAERIRLSQPAMSSALKRLRTIYGDPLFIRSPKGMIPNYRARVLQEPVFRALELLRASLTAKPEFNPATCDRTFRVAMTDWMGLNLLPPLTSSLKKTAPGVNLVVSSMTPRQMHQALIEGQIDLAISGQENYGRGKYQQRLYREHGLTIVWKGHSGIKNRLTLDQFIRYPHILFSPQGRGTGMVDRPLKKLGLKRRVAIRVVYSLVIPFMVLNTDLIATVPAPIARHYSALLDLRVFKPPLDTIWRDIVQYWDAKNHTEPAHRWFRGFLAQICKEFPS